MMEVSRHLKTVYEGKGVHLKSPGSYYVCQAIEKVVGFNRQLF